VKWVSAIVAVCVCVERGVAAAAAAAAAEGEAEASSLEIMELELSPAVFSGAAFVGAAAAPVEEYADDARFPEDGKGRVFKLGPLRDGEAVSGRPIPRSPEES
jgi:hypothetical protein